MSTFESHSAILLHRSPCRGPQSNHTTKSDIKNAWKTTRDLTRLFGGLLVGVCSVTYLSMASQQQVHFVSAAS
jgi:hypothetical protein